MPSPQGRQGPHPRGLSCPRFLPKEASEDLPPVTEQKLGRKQGSACQGGTSGLIESQLTFFLYELQNHRGLWSDSQLLCRKNVVARQVREASAELGSRNQTTLGGSQKATATGQPSPLPTTSAQGDPPPNLVITQDAREPASPCPPPPQAANPSRQGLLGTWPGQPPHPTPPKAGGQRGGRLSPSQVCGQHRTYLEPLL